MRLYRSQIPRIASAIIQGLRSGNDIEVDDASVPEAEMDIVAIMEQYLKTEYRIVEQAKDLVESRGLTHSDLGRVKRELCERYQHPLGDDGIRWVVGQIIEGFMISRYIVEVYAEDQVLRRKIMAILKQHVVDDTTLDQEVRARLKNLQEGTPAWHIQYQKTMREVRRKHGLS